MTLAAMACFMLASTGYAQAASDDADAGSQPSVELITLGTVAGPPPTVDRTQSSNILMVNGTPYLIDAGVNVIRRIKQAGVDFTKVGRVFITHDHGDHTLGLPGLLSTIWYYHRQDPIHVYGPPGTVRTVDAAVNFARIDAVIRRADEHVRSTPLTDFVKVKDVDTGQFYQDDNLSVTAVENSHFQFPKGSKAADEFKSYSYRFDIGDLSVVFTGDTGLSPNVEKLAQGADVLVSECLALDEIKARRENTGTWQAMSEKQRKTWYHHMLKEHITPKRAGKLAQQAGVDTLILTHLSSSGVTGDDYERYAQQAATEFDGLIIVAHDLMKFTPKAEYRFGENRHAE